MPTTRLIRCDACRDSVCMGDDVDARHESSMMIDCNGIDDVALHCAREVAASGYIPSVVGGSTWVAEAGGLPFAVVVRSVGGVITVTGAERPIAVTGETLALFFSYRLRHDPGELLAEMRAER